MAAKCVQRLRSFNDARISLCKRKESHLWTVEYKNISTGINDAKPVKLSKTVYGGTNDKEPLVILHGLMGSKHNWHSLAKAINAKTSSQVICLDQRNHGDSPHSDEMTYNHMAKDVKNFIDEEFARPVILLGHSMGGRTAMHLALSESELIEKLVIVDISPFVSSPSLHGMVQYFQAMRNLKFKRGITLSEARKSANEQLVDFIPTLAVRQFIITNLAEVGDGSFAWRIHLDALEKNFTNEIAHFPKTDSHQPYKKPSIFIGGADSDYIRKSDESGIRRIFPNVEFHYILGAGHWVHADKPNEFFKILISFLNK